MALAYDSACLEPACVCDDEYYRPDGGSICVVAPRCSYNLSTVRVSSWRWFGDIIIIIFGAVRLLAGGGDANPGH